MHRKDVELFAKNAVIGTSLEQIGDYEMVVLTMKHSDKKFLCAELTEDDALCFKKFFDEWCKKIQLRNGIEISEQA